MVAARGTIVDQVRALFAEADEDTFGGTETDDQFHERYGSKDITAIPRDPPLPLLIDRLAPDGHTILFGPGGVGKGVTAAWWIVQLVKEGLRVLILDYEDHPTEWSRRIAGLYRQDVPQGQVHHVSPLSAAWKGAGGAIWNQQTDIKAIAERFDAQVLVIDSIVPACVGMDASKGGTDVTSQYSAALQQIGLPALSLAHVTKDGAQTYPFGSVFWHNLARVTYSLSSGPDGVSTLMTMRKHNNYQRRPAVVMTAEWREGIPMEISEKPYGASVADLIDQVLTEPMSLQEVTTRLNALGEEDGHHKPDSVSKALRRGLAASPKRYTIRDKQWMPAGYEPPPRPMTLDGTEMEKAQTRRRSAAKAESSPHGGAVDRWS